MATMAIHTHTLQYHTSHGYRLARLLFTTLGALGSLTDLHKIRATLGDVLRVLFFSSQKPARSGRTLAKEVARGFPLKRRKLSDSASVVVHVMGGDPSLQLPFLAPGFVSGSSCACLPREMLPSVSVL